MTTPEREKVRQKKLTCTQKTASREIFSYCVKTSQENRSQAPELHQGNRLTSTKIASGIPYWPSRDPIQEQGGLNLYGFIGNNGVNDWDFLGLNNGDFVNPGETGTGQWPSEPKCCCIGEPEKCEIKVVWTKKGVAVAGLQKGGKKGDIGVHAQVFALVYLIHKEGKDVRACTLHQAAATVVKDLGVNKINPDDIIKSPPYYEDKPHIASAFNVIQNNLPQHTLKGHFRADVHVKEEPKVKTVWGFQVEWNWNFPAGQFGGKITRTIPAGGN